MSSRLLSTRGVLVLGLALSFCVGGVVAAAPASADDLPFVISSPTDGQSVPSGSITVTGTGTVGDTIGVSAPTDVYSSTSGVVDTTGHWTATLTVPLSASGSRQITAIDETTFRTSLEQYSVTVDLVPQSDLLRVTSPTSGSSAASRTITFQGTAPAGSVIRLDTAGTANTVPDITVDSTGAWSITTTYETADPQNRPLDTASATFTGHEPNGTAFVAQSVTGIALPAPAPTPVISGVSSNGTVVSVSGTASGGPAVALFFSPVDQAALTAANILPEGSFESTGVVDSSGRFTASTTLAAGQWKVTAVLLDRTDVHTAKYLSLASAATPFALTAAATSPADPGSAAPVAAAPVATTVPLTPAAASGSTELAYTGSTSPLPGVVGGAALLLSGLALVLVRRRRHLAGS